MTSRTSVMLEDHEEDEGVNEADISSMECTLDRELMQQIVSKQGLLNEVSSSRKAIADSISSGDRDLEQMLESFEANATLEAEAAKRLAEHKADLDKLGKRIQSKRAALVDKEDEQAAAITRLSEELARAQILTREKRARLQAATRAREETTAATIANTERCENGVISLAASNSAATEVYSAVSRATELMRSCVNSLASRVELVHGESETRRAAYEALKQEAAAASEVRKRSEAQRRAARAAYAAHVEDAARRARAHEFEVNRAEERAAVARALFEMHGRGPDLAREQKKARVAFEIASELLQAAQERRDAATRADEETTAALSASADRTSAISTQRAVIADALAARLEESKALLNKAVKVHACAAAALQAVQVEHNSLKSRLDVLFAQVEETEVGLKAAEEELVAAPRHEREALRNAEEAESLVVSRQEEAETTLLRAIDEARILAAQAREGARAPVDESHQARELDLLQASATATVADRQRFAQEADEAHKEAVKAVETAKQEFLEWRRELTLHRFLSSPSSFDNSISFQLCGAEDMDSDEPVGSPAHSQHAATNQARVAYYEEVLEERVAAKSSAEAALQAATDELSAVESQLKSLPKTKIIAPLELLVKSEIEVVLQLIASRAEAARRVRADAQIAEAAWNERRNSLTASLHSAVLKVTVAESDVQAAKMLKKSIMVVEKR